MTRAEKQTRTIARLLARALRHGEHAVIHWEKKKALLKEVQAFGILGPIELENGEQYILVKPSGHFVFYHDIDVKKVPKFKRQSGSQTSSPDASVSYTPEAVS